MLGWIVNICEKTHKKLLIRWFRSSGWKHRAYGKLEHIFFKAALEVQRYRIKHGYMHKE